MVTHCSTLFYRLLYTELIHCACYFLAYFTLCSLVEADSNTIVLSKLGDSKVISSTVSKDRRQIFHVTVPEGYPIQVCSAVRGACTGKNLLVLFTALFKL